MSYESFKRVVLQYASQFNGYRVEFHVGDGDFVAICRTARNAPIKFTANSVSLRITVRWGATGAHCAQVDGFSEI